LKTISQRVYGARVSLGFLSGGAELSDFDSNIVPIRTTRAYMALSGRLLPPLTVSLTGSVRENLLRDDMERQFFSTLAGKAIYRLSRQTTLSFEGSHIDQNGRGIDLRYDSAKVEISTRLRRLLVVFGIEKYKRDFEGELTDFKQAVLRLERKF